MAECLNGCPDEWFTKQQLKLQIQHQYNNNIIFVIEKVQDILKKIKRQ